jgi:hypothetical protein
VQRTNKRDIEKVLLQRESLRRTLLLLIEGAFAENDPDLSARVLVMYNQCPLVFDYYLQLSDPMTDDFDDPDDPDDSDDSDAEPEPEEFISLHSHGSICPRSFIASRDVQEKFHIPLRLYKLPIRHPFSQSLRDAYKADYDRPNIGNLGKNPTKWCRKVSFIIRYCHT